MTFRQASKLHNEDEVTEKKSGKVLRVIKTQIIRKFVMFECVDSGNNRVILTHKEVS